jgi:hypothetical protein
VKITYEYYLNSITFKTLKKKSFNCTASTFESEHKTELNELNAEKVLNLLGFVIGHQDKVTAIQFYYEKKMA